jgi:hypothetical protein
MFQNKFGFISLGSEAHQHDFYLFMEWLYWQAVRRPSQSIENDQRGSARTLMKECRVRPLDQ